jgi:hypothetical protein
VKLFTIGVGGKDHGRKTQGPEALDKDDVAILGGDMEKTFTKQMVCGLIGNAMREDDGHQGRDRHATSIHG